MPEALDDGECLVGEDERLHFRRDGRRGKDGIERTELGMAFEEAEPLSKVVFLDDKQRCEDIDVGSGQLAGVFPCPAVGLVRGEFLDRLGSRRGDDAAPLMALRSSRQGSRRGWSAPFA